jgi:microcystin-dependent protein
MVGEIKLFVSQDPPGGWLHCDGSAISRTTYANLYNIIGVQFGSGDGSTTFNIPDGRGRVAIGYGDGPSTSNRLIGQSGGEENHQLTEFEMPEHHHSYDRVSGVNGAPGSGSINIGSISSGSTGNTGANVPHNIMQPYFVINWIIKY